MEAVTLSYVSRVSFFKNLINSGLVLWGPLLGVSKTLLESCISVHTLFCWGKWWHIPYQPVVWYCSFPIFNLCMPISADYPYSSCCVTSHSITWNLTVNKVSPNSYQSDRKKVGKGRIWGKFQLAAVKILTKEINTRTRLYYLSNSIETSSLKLLGCRTIKVLGVLKSLVPKMDGFCVW